MMTRAQVGGSCGGKALRQKPSEVVRRFPPPPVTLAEV